MNEHRTLYSEPFPHCKASLSILNAAGAGAHALLSVNSGGASLSTYATADDLRAISGMALRAAVHLDAIAAREAAA